MFVITTDGQENASHRYNSEQVKKMIECQKEKYGWEFLFSKNTWRGIVHRL